MKTTAITPFRWKDTADVSLPQQDSALRFGLIAVGSGGCYMLPEVRQALGDAAVTTIAIDTDAQPLASSQAQYPLCLDQTATALMPEETLQTLFQALEPALALLDVVFLLAVLGEQTGAALSPAIAKLLAEQALPCVAVVITPFEFQGRRFQQRANQALQALQGQVSMLCEVPGEALLALLADDLTQDEAIERTTEWAVQTCRSLSAVFDQRNLVALDWADIQSALGADVLVMGQGTGTGPTALLQAWTAALDGPPLGVETLEHTEAVLVLLEGAPEALRLWQVRDFMAMVRKMLPLDARLLLSALPLTKKEKKEAVVDSREPSELWSEILGFSSEESSHTKVARDGVVTVFVPKHDLSRTSTMRGCVINFPFKSQP